MGCSCSKHKKLQDTSGDKSEMLRSEYYEASGSFTATPGLQTLEPRKSMYYDKTVNFPRSHDSAAPSVKIEQTASLRSEQVECMETSFKDFDEFCNISFPVADDILAEAKAAENRYAVPNPIAKTNCKRTIKTSNLTGKTQPRKYCSNLPLNTKPVDQKSKSRRNQVTTEEIFGVNEFGRISLPEESYAAIETKGSRLRRLTFANPRAKAKMSSTPDRLKQSKLKESNTRKHVKKQSVKDKHKKRKKTTRNRKMLT